MPLTDIRTAEQVAAEAIAAHKARCVAAIDDFVETQARALEYNSAAHLAGYATSTVAQWAAEAQAFVAWRDACWIAALTLLAQAEGGGDVPSVDDVLAALPEWPGV